MTEPTNPDTWSARDLPVLRAAALGVDEDPNAGIRIHEIAERTGIDVDDVYRATRALDSAGLIDVRWLHPSTHGRIVEISGHARQLVGQWPTEETALERIIAALEAIAANTDDEDERTKAQRFAAWLRSGATTVGLSVASAAITGQIPGHG
jgi:hypothetical protein